MINRPKMSPCLYSLIQTPTAIGRVRRFLHEDVSVFTMLRKGVQHRPDDKKVFLQVRLNSLLYSITRNKRFLCLLQGVTI